jgi:hypothetical protein
LALDITDDGLTPGMDVDVLHGDLLLSFASMPIESVEQNGKRP